MGKKKMRSLSDLGGFVFSTNDKEKFSDYEDSLEEKKLDNKEQFLEAHYSNKGRAGKIVTVIKGFVGSDTDLKILGKVLKKKCGVGGSVKNNEIIIQGKLRDKIMAILSKEGYNVKRVGG